jgi:phosphatidate phosphatase LPIN
MCVFHKISKIIFFFNLYRYAKVVVSDVDGTITKSDVLGHLAPMVGKDWNHAGVAQLYNNIKDNGYQLMFLSSRAISQSKGTRRYLEKLTQDGETLTQGPVMLAPDPLSTALYREVGLYNLNSVDL